METAVLMVGVAGLAVSGWFLRGFLIENPSAIQPPAPRVGAETVGVNQPQTGADNLIGSISSGEVSEIRQRLATLEKMGHTPRVEPVAVADTELVRPAEELNQARDNPLGPEPAPEVDSPVDASRWEEIMDLQRQYLEARAKEELIDYRWEESSFFDLNQSFNGEMLGTLSDGEREDLVIEQRLEDNLLEEGERVEDYQKRLDEFASLTTEVLVTRFDQLNEQLREQQKQHQAEVLSLLASLLQQSPSDGNWKRVAQSSFVAASAQISDVDGEPARSIFQEMYIQHTK